MPYSLVTTPKLKLKYIFKTNEQWLNVFIYLFIIFFYVMSWLLEENKLVPTTLCCREIGVVFFKVYSSSVKRTSCR